MIYISKNGKVDHSHAHENYGEAREWFESNGITWDGTHYVDNDGNVYRYFTKRKGYYVVKYFTKGVRNSIAKNTYDDGMLEHAKADAKAASANYDRVVVYRVSYNGLWWWNTVCEYRGGVYKSLSRSGKHESRP